MICHSKTDIYNRLMEYLILGDISRNGGKTYETKRMHSFDNHYVSFNYHPETDLRNQEVWLKKST